MSFLFSKEIDFARSSVEHVLNNELPFFKKIAIAIAVLHFLTFIMVLAIGWSLNVGGVKSWHLYIKKAVDAAKAYVSDDGAVRANDTSSSSQKRGSYESESSLGSDRRGSYERRSGFERRKPF